MPLTIEKAPKTLPEHAKHIWVAAFNSAYEGTCKGEDACAAKIAWSAVEKKYAKNKQGEWVAKSDFINEFSFVITKASYDEKTGERRWMATTSDTEMDSRNQRMSIELFTDFIRKAKSGVALPVEFQSEYFKGGMPYVSVSHYPDFNGEGSVGETKELYIDGNRLKAKGTFYNTPLGIKAFEAIYKSIHDKEPEPIRISIGFLDWKHRHGDAMFNRKSLYDVCPICTKTKENVVFLSGQLIHLALTRVPVNQRTIIEAEVEKSMTTRLEDAESIVGKEEAEKLEMKARATVENSEALVEKSEEKITPETVPSPEPVIEQADIPEEVSEDMPKEFTEDWATFDLPDEEKQFFDLEQEATVEEAAARKDVTPADKKAAEKKYGNVTYADEKNKKYPIDTEKHIRAAWNYIHMPKNAAKYSPAEVSAIKSKIVSAWKRVIGGTPAAAKKSETEPIVEKQEPVPVTVVDEPSEYRPFAGATSWKDADEWIATQQEASKFYDAWYMFQAISDNIMKSENDELPDKAKALKALMTDFQKNVTMKSFAILSKLEEKLVVEPKPIEAHPLDEAIAELKSVYNDTVSMEAPEDEKLQKLQPAFENFALVIRSSVKETPKEETVEPVKTSPEISEMKSMITELQTGMKTIVENVQLLMQTKSAVVARPAIPAPRNLNPSLVKKAEDTSTTPKLHAIIQKSVGLNKTG